MTVHNRERYLAAAIESVLCQTRDDFELLIVDDHSTDGSVGIARNYLSDPRVHLHVNVRNFGDYPNRDYAATLANGTYLKYVDSDDTIQPNCLEVMTSGMDAHPFCALGLSKVESSHGLSPQPVTPQEVYRQEYLGTPILGDASTAAIIRADRFRQVGGFGGERIGDLRLWLRLTQKYSLLLLPSGLTWRRQHPDQENERYHRLHATVTERLGIHLAALGDGCPLNEPEIVRARRNVTGVFLRRVVRHGLGGRIGLAVELLRRSGLRLTDYGSVFIRSQRPFSHSGLMGFVR